jgi:hypothetical protein
MQITTIGLDIAKYVFQVHGSDAAEKVVMRKRRNTAIMSDRHGGVRHGALLGAGADGTRSQGSVDAGEGCAGTSRATRTTPPTPRRSARR